MCSVILITEHISRHLTSVEHQYGEWRSRSGLLLPRFLLLLLHGLLEGLDHEGFERDPALDGGDLRSLVQLGWELDVQAGHAHEITALLFSAAASLVLPLH